MKENRKIFALGFFDGVHLGHQALLQACCRLAEDWDCRPAAASFDISPGAVLQNQPPQMINTEADRVALLRQYGIGPVCIYKANRETLSMSWQAFLETLTRQGAVGFVCGNDYRFGHKGEGNAEILQQYCEEKGLACIVVPEQVADGERISSSRIRTLLKQGETEQANRLLGHPHIFTGQVVRGKQLGRTIGFPTANLHLPPELLVPKLGVYACKVTVDGEQYMAVTNVGTCPTVGGSTVTAEAFLLNFSGDLYGKTVQVAFYRFLRPEEKFSGIEELTGEILKNAQQTEDFFKKSE